MSAILLRVLPYLAVGLLVACVLFGAYHQGVSVADAKWLSAWHQRDADDKAAELENEARERVREQAYQQSINKAVQDGQRTNDQAAADATAVRASSDSVRGAADKLPFDSQPVKPAAIPALPPQARQLLAPQWCLPTCSSALTSERATWLNLLTKPEPAEEHASSHTPP